MSNLLEACNQWSSRPADERFDTLEAMYFACAGYKQSARELLRSYGSLSVVPHGTDGADLAIIGPGNLPARLTHWSFGQLARNVGAPADYLRRLPAQLAANNLNYGIGARGTDGANLLIHNNGSLVLRSATTESYSRIWNADVVQRLLSFPSAGWRVPPARPALPDQPGTRPATDADVLRNREGGNGLSVKVGDLIAPAGLYASDHDMFAFLVNEDRRVNDGTHAGLSRGFFLTNSEVGAAALKVKTFLYRHVCGNHIVWDASGVQELRIIHRGEAGKRFQSELYAEIRRYADASTSEDESAIQAAQRFSLGTDKESVLDGLFKVLRGDLSRRLIDSAYDRACLSSDSDDTIDPRTAWGFAQGLTSLSQETPYADERHQMDRAAGKVLALAF